MKEDNEDEADMVPPTKKRKIVEDASEDGNDGDVLMNTDSRKKHAAVETDENSTAKKAADGPPDVIGTSSYGFLRRVKAP